MKLKHCPKCDQDLPKSSFTSTRAKYCNQCKRIVQLEQQKEAQNRAFGRLQKKKQKVVAGVRLSDYKKLVRSKVNAYVRKRDAGKPCISCGKLDKLEAGHYIPEGSTNAMRYNLDNLHGQCKQCNHWKSGNQIEYRIALVKKIGIEKVEWLEEHRHDTKKWTREELDQILEDISKLTDKL